jgi:cytochrome c
MRAVGLPAGSLAVVLAMTLTACERTQDAPEPLTGGDARRGQALIAYYGCGSCHSIPGVARANGLVGPPLHGIRERAYIGGVVPNTPDNLVRWIVDPHRLSPRTAMPSVGASQAEARDIAAYLYRS